MVTFSYCSTRILSAKISNRKVTTIRIELPILPNLTLATLPMGKQFPDVNDLRHGFRLPPENRNGGH